MNLCPFCAIFLLRRSLQPFKLCALHTAHCTGLCNDVTLLGKTTAASGNNDCCHLSENHPGLIRGLVTVVRGLPAVSSIPGIVQHCLSRCHPQNFCQRSFKAVVIMISAKCQHPCSEKSKRAPMPMMPNAILLTLHIIVRHNPHHPNWTMASIPDIVEHRRPL